MEQQLRKELVIMHFNDAYDIQPNAHGQLGFVNFYDYVQRTREAYPEALLVFSGDAFAPSRLSKLFKGQQMAHCLRLLNIDIACYGNHDFDFPPDHALKLAKSCKFPWLMGNIKYVDTGENIGQGYNYYIIDKNGIKIGFLGLAGPDFNGRLISEYKNKLRYIDMAEYAKKMCKQLRSLGCDLIIALTHARRPADVELAKKVPQIDLILGGHDHFQVFEIVNKIPIIKSSSDFECLSIVKIFQGQISAKQSKDTNLGRRWNVINECKKVKKSAKQYPQLEDYIKNAMKELQQYDRGKSINHNKPKANQPKLPPNKWQLSYELFNNKIVSFLNSGSSAEICMAKYIAFKKNHVFGGCKQLNMHYQPNYIEQTLKFIYQQLSSHLKVGKSVIIGPGFSSIPYLVQTANIVYLPSHFTITIDNIDQLIILLRSAQKSGYKCYVTLKYNPLVPNKVCALVKFIEVPKEYINIMSKFNIQNVIIMSKYTEGNKEAKAILLTSLQNSKKHVIPSPCDIFAIVSNEQEKNIRYTEDNYFKEILKNNEQLLEAYWRGQKSAFFEEQQNKIDFPQHISQTLKKALGNEKVRFYSLFHNQTWTLNLISYHIAKQFIAYNNNGQNNQTGIHGVVYNQGNLSNPTYELNYGYIPILYEPNWNNNQQRILQALTEEERELKRWFNITKGSRIGLIKHDSVKIATDHLGLQLAKWITKYAPKEYNLKYLPFEKVKQCLMSLKLLQPMQEQI